MFVVFSAHNDIKDFCTYTCKQHPCLHQFGDMTVTKLNKIDGIQKNSQFCVFVQF